MTASKDLANLFAECALGGFVLHHLQGDFGPLFVVTRDELTRQFNSPAEVREWLDRLHPAREPDSETHKTLGTSSTEAFTTGTAS